MEILLGIDDFWTAMFNVISFHGNLRPDKECYGFGIQLFPGLFFLRLISARCLRRQASLCCLWVDNVQILNDQVAIHKGRRSMIRTALFAIVLTSILASNLYAQTSLPAVIEGENASLSAPDSMDVSHLHYFGWYASANYTEETADHANVTWNWAGNQNAEALARSALNALKRADALGMTTVLDVGALFFAPDRTMKPSAEYLQNWQTFSKAIHPYRHTIAAFYPMDEPWPANPRCGYNDKCKKGWNSLNANLATAAFIMKSDYPEVPVAMIHSLYELITAIQGKRAIMNPANFDWHSFDCYGDFDSCGIKGVGSYSIPLYLDVLKKYLRPGQKLFLTPEAYLARTPVYGQATSEEVLIYRAYQYEALAEQEPLVIGMMGFLWQHHEMIGVHNLQSVAETWRQIARKITGRLEAAN